MKASFTDYLGEAFSAPLWDAGSTELDRPWSIRIAAFGVPARLSRTTLFSARTSCFFFEPNSAVLDMNQPANLQWFTVE